MISLLFLTRNRRNIEHLSLTPSTSNAEYLTAYQIHTSMGSPAVCQRQNLYCPNSVRLSWCRMDTARSYNRFSAIQLKAHIFLLNFAREWSPLRMNRRTHPAEMTCISTFEHINRSAISKRWEKSNFSIQKWATAKEGFKSPSYDIFIFANQWNDFLMSYIWNFWRESETWSIFYFIISLLAIITLKMAFEPLRTAIFRKRPTLPGSTSAVSYECFTEGERFNERIGK